MKHNLRLLPAMLITLAFCPSKGSAKGLDKLQADSGTEEASPAVQDNKPAPKPEEQKVNQLDSKQPTPTEPSNKPDAQTDNKTVPSSVPTTPALPTAPSTLAPAPAPAPATSATKTPAAPTPVEAPPIEPGLQKFYLAENLSLSRMSAASADWNSAFAVDLEGGMKVGQLPKNLTLFGTYRYSASDITATSKQRAYRGIIQTHNFGGKLHSALRPNLLGFASAELGLVSTRLTPSDGRQGVDKDLEKPGVELSVGGGVSYIVLDKIGIGPRLALGVGTYKTLQVGIDLRFLL